MSRTRSQNIFYHRDYLYTEWFYPNFDPDPSIDAGPSVGQQAVRNANYKLVKRTTGETGFFDLAADPGDNENLLPISTMSEPEVQNLNALLTYYNSLPHEGLLGLCEEPLKPVGDECEMDDECCSQFCVPVSSTMSTCQNPPRFDD